MTTTPETIPLPRMHSQYAGGEVMGVMAGEAGAPDYLLIHIGNSPKGMPFESALQWSRDQSGEEGPTPRELKMLEANRREGQFRNVGHWSSAPSAGDERYAWVQYFDHGDQYYGHKDNDSVAVAVRRVPFK